MDILDLLGYADQWGHDYYNFYRDGMHKMIQDTATAAQGEGEPVTIKMDHSCESLDLETGCIAFSNGKSVQHDLVIGADGIGSCVRRSLGIIPDRKRATSSCIHCVIKTSDVHPIGLPEMARSDALEYWGQGLHKIVYSACRGGSIQSFYLFFPLSSADLKEDTETWLEGATYEQALRPFPNLDPRLRTLLAHSVDIRPWRFFEHSPYATWQQGRTCIMGMPLTPCCQIKAKARVRLSRMQPHWASFFGGHTRLLIMSVPGCSCMSVFANPGRAKCRRRVPGLAGICRNVLASRVRRIVACTVWQTRVGSSPSKRSTGITCTNMWHPRRTRPIGMLNGLRNRMPDIV